MIFPYFPAESPKALDALKLPLTIKRCKDYFTKRMAYLKAWIKNKEKKYCIYTGCCGSQYSYLSYPLRPGVKRG
jgi:hypothetical protein